ncbi:MAG: 50S ribosomal protein L34e [Nanoarchaeota archaeon]|nr:50S ribosomal protein L34e [Nanoarchaeota archaeon]
MTKKTQRSRSMRRVFVKTPGGKNVIHYRKRKPSKAKCASCGKVLQGVPRERPYKMSTMAKSKKRPNRPYGGKLCSSCTRKVLTNVARA